MMTEFYQPSIFESTYDPLKIGNKIVYLHELFAGIGAQRRALENVLGYHVNGDIVEWSAQSLMAYALLHHKDRYASGKPEGEWLTDEECLKMTEGVSLDYNKSASQEQRARKGKAWNRQVVRAMLSSNCVCADISKAYIDEPLDCYEKETYFHIMTYSFPCQDLSLIKHDREGFNGARSGLLKEVERILRNAKSLPDMLLMENVPAVHDKKNKDDFVAWLEFLESIGYTNYYQDLNAKDFGVPQNRNRCFCVSLLGNYSYTFPKGKKLDKKLRDFLDEQVDDKYFLSDRMLNFFYEHTQEWQDKYVVNFKNKNIDLAFTILCAEGTRTESSYVIEELGDFELAKLGDFELAKLGDLEFALVRGEDVIYLNGNVRRLTPCECLRLQGFEYKDYARLKNNDFSDTAIIHFAGDTICVPVLEAIFRQLL